MSLKHELETLRKKQLEIVEVVQRIHEHEYEEVLELFERQAGETQAVINELFNFKEQKVEEVPPKE